MYTTCFLSIQEPKKIRKSFPDGSFVYKRVSRRRRIIVDRKKLYPVFSMAAVIIFFIWGWLEGTYAHSRIIRGNLWILPAEP